MEVRPGVQVPGWLEQLPGFLQNAAGRLVDPRLVVEAGRLTLEGKHVAEEGKEQLLVAARKAFGETMKIEDKTWVPKSMGSLPAKVRISTRSDRVLLLGELSDAAARDALVKGAQKALPGAEVVDEIRLAPEVKVAEWPPILGAFLPEFANSTTDGEITVDEEVVTLAGTARNAESRDALLAGLARELPDALKLRDQLKILEEPSRAKKADTFTIYYRSASTYIGKKGRLTLGEAASAIREAGDQVTVSDQGVCRCPRRRKGQSQAQPPTGRGSLPGVGESGNRFRKTRVCRGGRS